MLKVVQTGLEGQLGAADVAAGSLLDEIAREGARRMLAAALKAEADLYVDELVDQVDEDGHRLVVRNGHHDPRTVTTAAGAIEVHAPRVNDKRVDEGSGERKRFSSAILPAWCRRSPKVSEVLPLLYLHGVVRWRLRAGARAVPRHERRPVGLDDHPAHRAVARRATHVRQA